MVGRRYSMGMTLVVVLALFLSQQPETLSLLGAPLYAPSLSKADKARAHADLATARAVYDREPSKPEAILGLEQALLALGRIGDALELLTHGLEANPDEPRLLLQRGRSYITIRKFDVASRDLVKAAETLPAARCVLGLAQYLAADYARAHATYGKCADPGVFGYLANRRAGGSETSRPVATGALPTPATTIKLPGSVSSPASDAPQPIAASYLEAIERMLAGDEDDARERMKKIVEKHRRDWMEPAYIAAEVEYARLKKTEKRRNK
jgi:tetratricopeptide (TPR) repeat protein